jgi:sensor histidine kinase YesM
VFQLRTHPQISRISVLSIVSHNSFSCFVRRNKSLQKTNRISLYWKCQLTGWSLASLYWAYQAFSEGAFDMALGLFQFVTDVALYIALTHLYRNFVHRHRWRRLGLDGLLPRIIPAILVMGLLYTVTTITKIYWTRILLLPNIMPGFVEFAGTIWTSVLIGGIRLMTIWLLAYHLYQYAQREIRLAGENARLEVVSRDAQLNNLSSQLNPHFLFNSLNTIKSLIATEPSSARRGIDLLSELLRSGLYQGESIQTTVKAEMELVKDYLELEKMRMEERLVFCIEVDPSLEENTIPRLAIQTLVENAVKHGVSSQLKGGMIRIAVIKTDPYITITVENAGKIDHNHTLSGIGIKNLKERCTIMYQGNFSFAIQQAAENKVCATLSIPLR